MLDLSYLKPEIKASSDDGLEAAYAEYLSRFRVQHPAGTPMSPAEFERLSIGSNWLGGIKDAAKKLVQTCRLMVGVHDYEYYVDHMRSRHPGADILSREDFFRYC